MFEFLRSKTLTRTLILLLSIIPITAFSEETSIGGDFELTSQFNQPYSSTDAHGKVVLLFFGFTHCPDVCPNTLSTVQTVLGQLGDNAEHVQPIFISVDPQRDKPEILKNYLQYFHSNYIGLTGTSEEVDKVVKQFQGFYSFKGDVSGGNYSVDHTSNLYIINTLGKVTNIIPYGLPPQAITNAIEKILSEAQA
jgi:cytochrome oxidase Cu insertion factor (SCO1/SenC/PrrC family)